MDSLKRYKEREKDGPVSLEEYDEAKWENERLKSECLRIKKVILIFIHYLMKMYLMKT